MKPAYNNIELASGVHVGGMCIIQVAPKEWLASDATIDFATGAITVLPAFIFGRNWITLTFSPTSYDFNETPKSGRQGSFIETVIAGTANNIDAATLQILQTLRYHQLVCVATDRRKKVRMTGDKNNAMIFQYTVKNTNTGNGQQSVAVQLTYESEDPSLFAPNP
jgi:hypothetical protein